MSQVGAANSYRAPGSAAATITVGKIVEVGDDYEYATTGTAAAVIVLDGDTLRIAASGTAAASLVELGDNIRILEV